MRSDLARKIYEVANLTGTFTLRSGQVSSEYFDKFQFTSRPDLLEAVAEAMAGIVPPDVEVLAGLQLGGVPLAAALALKTRIPAVFVRLQRKPYATQKIAEGVDLNGKVVAIPSWASRPGQSSGSWRTFTPSTRTRLIRRALPGTSTSKWSTGTHPLAGTVVPPSTL